MEKKAIKITGLRKGGDDFGRRQLLLRHLDNLFTIRQSDGGETSSEKSSIDGLIRICDLENAADEFKGLQEDLDAIKAAQKTSSRANPILIAICLITKHAERSKRVSQEPEKFPFRFTCIHVLGESALKTISESVASACSHILNAPERCLSSQSLGNEWKHSVAIDNF